MKSFEKIYEASCAVSHDLAEYMSQQSKAEDRWEKFQSSRNTSGEQLNKDVNKSLGFEVDLPFDDDESTEGYRADEVIIDYVCPKCPRNSEEGCNDATLPCDEAMDMIEEYIKDHNYDNYDDREW